MAVVGKLVKCLNLEKYLPPARAENKSSTLGSGYESALIASCFITGTIGAA